MIAFIFIHIKMTSNYGDDVYSREHYADVWGSMFTLYKTWSSPSLATVVQLYLVKWPDFIFKICNLLVIILSAYSIIKITEDRSSKYQKWMVIFFIMLYPFMQMGTAGWIITSTIYYFPLSFGLYSLIYLKYIYDGKEINKLQYISFWFALVMGLGNLQMCCIILGAYTVLNIFFFIKKKIFKYSILQNVTSLIFFIYHATAPGNINRSGAETITWFPDFNMLSITNKIKICFTATLGNLISDYNVFFLCFTILIIFGVYCKYKEILYRCISLIPFLASVLFGFGKNIFSSVIPNLIALMNNGQNNFLQIDVSNFECKKNYLSIILGVIIVGSILISIYLIFENTLKMLLIELIFLLGFASRMIMSFSPTVYASGIRTFIFLYFSILVCAVFIFNDISENI
ncbi:DUF6056 family protein, partial [Clostridium saccharoperbutylacetonicum]